MKGTIAEGTLYGYSFLRVYVVDPGLTNDLTNTANKNDYTFVYSLADLGELDGFTKETKATQLIALDGTEEEVFAGLNRNNRYKVRRSYRDDGVGVIMDDPERDRSLDFYRQIKLAEGVEPDIDEDFAMVRWINAYHDDELVAATCWFDSGEVLRAKHIVSTRKESGSDTALVGRLTRRLFWEACLTGIEEGHRYVDLGGVDTDAEEKSGVAEFKQSFGGNQVDVFVYRHASDLWSEAVTKASAAGRTVV